MDFDLLHTADKTYGAYVGDSCVLEPQEPIHVHVRVRQSGDSYPSASRACCDNLDLGKLSVGSILDCYV